VKPSTGRNGERKREKGRTGEKMGRETGTIRKKITKSETRYEAAVASEFLLQKKPTLA
jgi:hypothetical protein